MHRFVNISELNETAHATLEESVVFGQAPSNPVGPPHRLRADIIRAHRFLPTEPSRQTMCERDPLSALSPVGPVQA